MQTTVVGVSGFEHNVLALGVDRNGKRLVVISPEAEPRVAAMVQADLQAAAGDIQVLTARPIYHTLHDDGIDRLPREARQRRADAIAEFRKLSAVSPAHDMKEAVHAAAPFIEALHINPDAKAAVEFTGTAADIAVGICPFPIYAFSADDLEIFLRGDADETLQCLRERGIAQYFFPSPDQVALGLIDRDITRAQNVESLLASLPSIGHPLAKSELVDSSIALPEILDALADKKFIAEGEISYELTPQGRSVRSSVRFKPRESLLSKIINRFSVSLNLKDLFGP